MLIENKEHMVIVTVKRDKQSLEFLRVLFIPIK
jgi:hypothetical protein